MTAALVAGPYVNAAVLAVWELNHLSGVAPSPESAGTILAEVDTAELSRNRDGASYSNAFAMRSYDDTSLADAITAGTYLSVSLTAASGFVFDTLTEFFVSIEANNITDGRSIAIFSDATGFTIGDELYSIDLYAGGAGLGQYSTHTVDLSGVAALQGISDVEFRIYNWGSSGSWNALAVGRGFETWQSPDDLRIEGTTAVPEPATFALLSGFGALGLVLLRRRLILARA